MTVGFRSGALGRRSAAGGGSTVTAKQFRIESTIAHSGSGGFWSIAEVGFLAVGGSMPGGYTNTSGGVTPVLGTYAELFDGSNGRTAFAQASGFIAVSYPTPQAIETIRLRGPTSFSNQWPREWKLSTRNDDADPWVEVARFMEPDVPAVNASKDYAVVGYTADEVGGWLYFKFEVISNYGQAGAETYFAEMALYKSGVSVYPTALKTRTGGTAELVDGTESDQEGHMFAPLPSSMVLEMFYKKAVDQMRIRFRNSTWASQGPNRMKLYGSNDGSSFTEILDTGTTGTAPTNLELRTYSV